MAGKTKDDLIDGDVTENKTKLKKAGIPTAKVDELIHTGKTRKAIIEDLVAYCRTLPKAP